MISRFLFPMLSTALGLSFPSHARTADAPAGVVFDWFEYSGRDAVFAGPLPPAFYRNPVLAGFYPDPSICRVGDDYYLVNSTFAYFPGIPIFHSRDLAHWQQLGHVLDRASQLKLDGLGVSRGVFAPAISHHDGVFYVINTLVDAGGNFFVTAKNPAGPWSDPVWLREIDGIDPSFFFDDDGHAYIVNNGPPPDGKRLYEGHAAIWLQEFDVAAQNLVGLRAIIVNGGVDPTKHPKWIEGPHLFKKGGWYYLICAEGGTEENHSEVVFRSRTVWGPWLPGPRNPILTQRTLPGTRPDPVTNTGHADFVVTPDGAWWAVFLGCRPYEGPHFNTGRETFMLPVTWTDDGWPVILPPGQSVPYVLPAPRTKHDGILQEVTENAESNAVSKAVSSASSACSCENKTPVPLTGNFTWRDEFDGLALAPLWLMLRTPHETWWRTGGGQNGLQITPRMETLSGTGNPSFLGRRLQHSRFEAKTSLMPPAATGVSAGLVAFQNETHHYFLGVRRSGGELEIFLERANGHAPETIARAAALPAERIELRLTGDGRMLAFAFRSGVRDWQTLVPDADATVLSKQTAGGFIGAMIGLHARLEP